MDVLCASGPAELRALLQADGDAAEAALPLREYLNEVISAQASGTTASPLPELTATLATFLLGCGGALSTPAAADAAATALVEALNAAGMLAGCAAAEAASQPAALTEAVVMGRVTQVSAADRALQQQAQGVNTNTDLDWEAKRALQKAERRKRKEDEKKAALTAEYTAYLAARGISGSRTTPVKVHGGADGGWRGEAEIRCGDVHLTAGSTVLLDNADVVIAANHKYGMVGRNGVGKTTLLRHIASGELEGVSPYVQILHIDQEVTGDAHSALDTVLAADVERTRLLAEETAALGAAGGEEKLAEIYARLDAIDAHTAEARASAILSGLSFSREMMQAPTSSLSGGWRMRVALARALYVAPDVLLLDEPTNHLDLHAVLWLEHTLQKWTGTLVVVSHSRSFLNNVVSDVIHYVDRKLVYYKGDYDAFERLRMEKLRTQKSAHEAQAKQRAHMQEFVERFRCNAKRAALVQSRLKALAKMDFTPAVVEDPSFRFQFPDPDPVPGPHIQAQGATFSYSGKPLFSDVDFCVDLESRIALVGANGAGKSTFLQILNGRLTPTVGRVMRGAKVRVAHFTQHHVDTLPLQLSALELLRQRAPGAVDETLRAQLSRFGLPGDRQLQPMFTLSGGQKSRVAFAVLTLNNPHIMLLDEPTNHLDIDTVEALIASLETWAGGVVMVTHDEHLIRSAVDEIWICGGGQLAKFDGDFTAYRKSLDLAAVARER